MKKLNHSAQATSIDEALETIKTTYDASTSVVAWYDNYASQGEIRGPFGRWLIVQEIQEEYKKHCGSIADDARYATAAMNLAPLLVEEIESLRRQLDEIKHQRNVERSRNDANYNKLYEIQTILKRIDHVF